MKRFPRARAETGDDSGWASGRIRYWTVLGSRLLDAAVPAAVTETRTATGVVPDRVAVDLLDLDRT
ncbi:hypothetical protein [Streptomyces sviceus]|uniref:hypothetical protein n=1 Tax=Streptomyces sviceus TaxID=285530 RepID=UPI0036EA19CB